MMQIVLKKYGDNPNQRDTAAIKCKEPDEGYVLLALKVGDIIHVQGQPDDVKWQVAGVQEVTHQSGEEYMRLVNAWNNPAKPSEALLKMVNRGQAKLGMKRNAIKIR